MFYMYGNLLACISVHHKCAWCPKCQKRASDSQQLQLLMIESLSECLESNPSSLGEQLVLLIAELSIQVLPLSYLSSPCPCYFTFMVMH